MATRRVGQGSPRCQSGGNATMVRAATCFCARVDLLASRAHLETAASIDLLCASIAS